MGEKSKAVCGALGWLWVPIPGWPFTALGLARHSVSRKLCGDSCKEVSGAHVLILRATKICIKSIEFSCCVSIIHVRRFSTFGTFG